MSMYWVLPTVDETMIAAMNSSVATLKSVLSTDLGDAPGVPYNNYAAATTTVEELFGTNLERLMQIKKVVDPSNIMGLAGGFKILPAA